MTDTGIYSDIAVRTGGDIYIGVVGPVRTGKSTYLPNNGLAIMPDGQTMLPHSIQTEQEADILHFNMRIISFRKYDLIISVDLY